MAKGGELVSLLKNEPPSGGFFIWSGGASLKSSIQALPIGAGMY
jgi:hypothetical protein